MTDILSEDSLRKVFFLFVFNAEVSISSHSLGSVGLIG